VHNVVCAVINRYAFCNNFSGIQILSNCCPAHFKCTDLGKVLCTRTNEARSDTGRVQITTNSTRYSLKRALPAQPPSQQDCTEDVSAATCPWSTLLLLLFRRHGIFVNFCAASI
jgi:hypothetical protein